MGRFWILPLLLELGWARTAGFGSPEPVPPSWPWNRSCEHPSAALAEPKPSSPRCWAGGHCHSISCPWWLVQELPAALPWLCRLGCPSVSEQSQSLPEPPAPGFAGSGRAHPGLCAHPAHPPLLLTSPATPASALKMHLLRREGEKPLQSPCPSARTAQLGAPPADQTWLLLLALPAPCPAAWQPWVPLGLSCVLGAHRVGRVVWLCPVSIQSSLIVPLAGTACVLPAALTHRALEVVAFSLPVLSSAPVFPNPSLLWLQSVTQGPSCHPFRHPLCKTPN